MVQAKFSITDARLEFLSRREQHRFRDKSEVVRAARDHLKSQLLRRRLAESAETYAEMYSKDAQAREWTEAATLD